MPDLVSRVDRANGAISLTSRTDRRTGRHVMSLVVRGLCRCNRFVDWGTLDFGHVGQ
jgi:hypothetical protein